MPYPIQESISNLLNKLVGKVKGYFLDGMNYISDEGNSYILGEDVLTPVLDELVNNVGILDSYKISGTEVSLVFDVDVFKDNMEGAGYRDMEYDEQQAIEDIKSDPSGNLSSFVNLYGIKVDPYSYANEEEPEDFMPVEDF